MVVAGVDALVAGGGAGSRAVVVVAGDGGASVATAAATLMAPDASRKCGSAGGVGTVGAAMMVSAES